jgi:hypothetical protein
MEANSPVPDFILQMQVAPQRPDWKIHEIFSVIRFIALPLRFGAAAR